MLAINSRLGIHRFQSLSCITRTRIVLNTERKVCFMGQSQPIQDSPTAHGLYEIAIGIMYLLVALVVTLDNSFPNINSIFVFAPLFAGILIVFRIVEVIKKRIIVSGTTYTKSYYPKYRPLYLGLVIVVIITLLSILQIFFRERSLFVDRNLPLLIGSIVTSFAIFWLGSGSRRLNYLAIASILAGIVLSFLKLDAFTAYMTFFMFIGLSLLVSGFFTLNRYISRKA